MRNTFFWVCLLASFSLFSQKEGAIKGNIVDLEANNEPLLFADVALEDTDFKTRTNFNGNFEIVGVSPGKYNLEISFLGYETLSMPVEVTENKVTRVQSGLSAKSISSDPLALSNHEPRAVNNAVASLVERNMED